MNEAEPTNWNVTPRHPHKPPGRPRKAFQRVAEREPDTAPAFNYPAFEPPATPRTSQKLVVDMFTLGMSLLLMWTTMQPELLYQLIRQYEEYVIQSEERGG